MGLFEGENSDMLQDGIVQNIKELDGRDGVYGGTPSNRVAFSSAKSNSRIAYISGANFPMLVDCLLARNSFTLERQNTRINQRRKGGGGKSALYL